MSTTADDKNRPRFYGYPPIRKGPETPPYAASPGNNPVLRGLPLAIVGFLFVYYLCLTLPV